MAKEKGELFQVPASIQKMETMTDGVRIVFDTQDIADPEEIAKLFRLKKHKTGWLLFKQDEIQAEEVTEAPAPVAAEGETRTPSERLRGVLFVYWKEVKKSQGNFDAFYRSIIEQLIEAYKEKLPPRE